MADKKVTVLDVKQAKEEGRKLTMLTAYDYPLGLMAAESGVDIVLVGDSLGMVVMGLQGTVEVTMEDMIHHIKAVVRGATEKTTFWLACPARRATERTAISGA